MRQEFDEVESAMVVAPVDLFYGNVMTASVDLGLHPRDAEFLAGKACIPHMHLEALGGGLCKEPCNRIPIKYGLDRKSETLLDGLLEQSYALMPGRTVGVYLCQRGIRDHQCPSGLVRIEIHASVLANGRSADAALFCQQAVLTSLFAAQPSDRYKSSRPCVLPVAAALGAWYLKVSSAR